MMSKRLCSLFFVLSLAACSTPAIRIDLSPIASDLRLRADVSSVMLRDVSLPSYAAAEEIAQEIEPGLIGAQSGILWADDPERAVTLAVTRHLDTILDATVGPDPWPFVGLPDVAIEVQVAEMLAGADGNFRFSGQYYVGGDGLDFPNKSESFGFSVPLTGEDVAAVARAQAQALLLLSEMIARDLS